MVIIEFETDLQQTEAHNIFLNAITFSYRFKAFGCFSLYIESYICFTITEQKSQHNRTPFKEYMPHWLIYYSYY